MTLLVASSHPSRCSPKRPIMCELGRQTLLYYAPCIDSVCCYAVTKWCPIKIYMSISSGPSHTSPCHYTWPATVIPHWRTSSSSRVGVSKASVFHFVSSDEPVPDTQPSATELFQSPLYGSGTVFRSISHLLRHFPSSALAWRHTSSNSVIHNYCCRAREVTLSFMDTLIALTYLHLKCMLAALIWSLRSHGRRLPRMIKFAPVWI